MSEILLLGAGASVSAGVPGAYAMSGQMLRDIQSNLRFQQSARVLSYVMGGLLFQAGKRGENPLDAGVNVEELFNAVQLLAQRNSLEAAPFVGSWDTMVEELDRPAASSQSLDKTIYESVSQQIIKSLSKMPSSSHASNIDNTLVKSLEKAFQAAARNQRPNFSSSESVGRAVEDYLKRVSNIWQQELKSSSSIGNSAQKLITADMESRTGSGEGQIFDQTNQLMIAALKNLVWISDAEKIAYLGPILNLLEQQKRLVVATLNYDNAIELMGNSQGREVNTGVEEWSKNGAFSCQGEGIHLLKLHGSIDWQKTGEESFESLGSSAQLPQIGIEQVQAQNVAHGYFTPALIFGQRNKLTADGPFLDLLRAFQFELNQAQTLTVIGYSFRDPHINVYIFKWLNSDVSRKIRIVNGPNFPDAGVDAAQRLQQLAQTSPQRVQIVPDYAQIAKENRVNGLETLFGEYQGDWSQRGVALPSAIDAITNDE